MNRIAKTLAITAAAVAIGVPVTSSPAEAAGTYARANGSVPVFNGPNSSLYYFEAPNYVAVKMLCWTDAQNYKVNYWSNRWFKVSTPYTSTAWMHSSEVYNQTTVPHC